MCRSLGAAAPAAHHAPVRACHAATQAWSFDGAAAKCYLKGSEGWTVKAKSGVLSWVDPQAPQPPTGASECWAVCDAGWAGWACVWPPAHSWWPLPCPLSLLQPPPAARSCC